jgi:hypothetical protein
MRWLGLLLLFSACEKRAPMFAAPALSIGHAKELLEYKDWVVEDAEAGCLQAQNLADQGTVCFVECAGRSIASVSSSTNFGYILGEVAGPNGGISCTSYVTLSGSAIFKRIIDGD